MLLLATSALLIAGGPALTRVDPPGGRAGTALRLTLVGNGLDGKLTVHSKIPGVLTQLSSADEGKEYLLEIDGEAAVGAYPLQVESEAGLSNTLLFSVSSFPETVEKESTLKRHLPANDSAPNAESLVVPGTVNGTLVGADRDLYRLQLASGDNLTFEVESQRLGSAIDPAIVITDADGKRWYATTMPPVLGLTPGCGSWSQIQERTSLKFTTPALVSKRLISTASKLAPWNSLRRYFRWVGQVAKRWPSNFRAAR